MRLLGWPESVAAQRDDGFRSAELFGGAEKKSEEIVRNGQTARVPQR